MRNSPSNCPAIRLSVNRLMEFHKYDEILAGRNLLQVFSYPVHVKGEKDLVHVAAGFLRHTVHLKHSLELEERYKS